MNPVIVVLGVFMLIMIASAIVIVPENRRGVVVRLGRHHKTLKPGLHVRLPLIDLVTKVDLDSTVPGWQGLTEKELESAVESFVSLGAVVRAKPVSGRSAPVSTASSSTREAQALTAWLLRTAGEQTGVDLSNDPLAKQRIAERAQSAIEELRSSNSCEIHLPFLTADQNGPKNFSTSLTRSKLDEILGSGR